MRVEAFTVRNYRCLKDVIIEVDKYGVFIGANGSGKSSALYALDWFFNGTALSNSDIHGFEESGGLTGDETIEVRVRFTDLTPKDRERLQQYGRGDHAEIRRTWYTRDNKVKTVGNAKQGPGFTEVRELQGVSDRRKAYRSLREAYADLPELPVNASKDAIFDALAEWESESKHAEMLIEVQDSDATQMMGWNGTNVLKECVRFILIPAATSIAGEVGTAARGTTLTELVGTFMAEASARAQKDWLIKHAAAVEELTGTMRTNIEEATRIQATRINSRLTALVPNASVVFTPMVPEFAPKIDASMATTVSIGDSSNDVSRQGHGVQRAVLISMLQVVVPDEDLMRKTDPRRDDEDDLAARVRLDDAVGALPTTVFAIEEPEIYQHPIRARAFARTLSELSESRGVQVLLATHSPYFVHPKQFEALHRFTCTGGETAVTHATIASVVSTSGLCSDTVRKAIKSHVPTDFAEGFFADAVALVEGQTDRVIIEALAARLNQHLDSNGVTVRSVQGKDTLRVARAILVSLGIPTYVLADGDFGTADRKVYRDKTKEQIEACCATARASHRNATEVLLAALPQGGAIIHGRLPYEFGEPTVVSSDFAMWRDDIEEELGTWPSFVEALRNDGVDLAARNNKNVLKYNNAIMAADDEEIPETLKSVVNHLVKLSQLSASQCSGEVCGTRA